MPHGRTCVPGTHECRGTSVCLGTYKCPRDVGVSAISRNSPCWQNEQQAQVANALALAVPQGRGLFRDYAGVSLGRSMYVLAKYIPGTYVRPG